MTQVSRFPLPKTLENQMFELFYGALADLHSKRDVRIFLEDLLTPTERVMLAKRLAIAILLDKGHDQRTVHTIMKVSLATVNSVNYWLKNQGNGYRRVIHTIRSEEKWVELNERLNDFIDDVLHGAKSIYPRIKEVQPIDAI